MQWQNFSNASSSLKASKDETQGVKKPYPRPTRQLPAILRANQRPNKAGKPNKIATLRGKSPKITAKFPKIRIKAAIGPTIKPATLKARESNNKKIKENQYKTAKHRYNSFICKRRLKVPTFKGTKTEHSTKCKNHREGFDPILEAITGHVWIFKKLRKLGARKYFSTDDDIKEEKKKPSNFETMKSQISQEKMRKTTRQKFPLKRQQRRTPTANKQTNTPPKEKYSNDWIISSMLSLVSGELPSAEEHISIFLRTPAFPKINCTTSNSSSVHPNS
ncbi:hypothetical protein STAS_06840 [Striga asiatica]|uniref:Uncharacterized protein n=1 Tax=Striga asiatica TaxID=4170 RepID=A0A5A7PD59_STRAF|nr:hypothetical protein STAS_06840 [Striga asiatica]